MKKILSVLTVSAFLFVCANSAIAGCWGWCPKDVTATGHYAGQAYDYEYDSEHRGNDESFGAASGGPGAVVDTYANGYGYAQQSGFILGDGDADAWAWTKDRGLESKAGSGAKVGGSLIAGGEAVGLFGNRETVTGHTYFSGEVQQGNHAEESGYSYGSHIMGGNTSYATMVTNNDYFSDSGRGFAAAGGIESCNELKTVGKTEVSIDPYGQYRSIKGTTETETTTQARNGISTSYMDGSWWGWWSDSEPQWCMGCRFRRIQLCWKCSCSRWKCHL
jgi:hypothetical protein